MPLYVEGKPNNEVLKGEPQASRMACGGTGRQLQYGEKYLARCRSVKGHPIETCGPNGCETRGSIEVNSLSMAVFGFGFLMCIGAVMFWLRKENALDRSFEEARNRSEM